MKNMSRRHLLVLLLFLLANLIPHIYVALSRQGLLLNWYLTDDAFYYFKTAQNIVEGNGITFDGLSPTNGFHPLWMLICLPVFVFARINLYLPLRILVVIEGLLNALSGYFLYRILADRLSRSIGLLAAFLWMFLPPIHAVTTKLGLESGINALSIFLLVFLVARFLSQVSENKKASLWYIGLAGVVCLFSRLDNIFIVGMVGIWLVFHDNQIRRYVMLDFVLITLSVLISYFARIQVTDNILNFLPFAYTLLILSLAIKPVMLYIFGAYGEYEQKDFTRAVVFPVISVAIASLLISIVVYLLFDLLGIFMGYSRSVLALDFLLSMILLTGVRLFRWQRCKNLGCDEVDISLKAHWKEWLNRIIAYFLPVFGFLGAYMAFNEFYAGSAMPVSGKIKHWWGTLPNTIYGRPIKTLSGVISSFFDPNPETGPLWLLASPIQKFTVFLMRLLNLTGSSTVSVRNFISAILWIGLAAFTFVLVYRYWKEAGKLFNLTALPAVAVGLLIHILSYRATGYLHAKYWYWIGEMVMIFLFLSIIIGIALKHISRRLSWVRAVDILLIALSVISFIDFNFSILKDFPINGRAAELYDVDAEKLFIDRETKPGDVIGMTGGGLLGYFIPDRTFVNLDGLINSPEYFERMKSNQTDQYFDRIGMKFVYGEEATLLDSDPFRWMFTGKLRFVDKGPFFSLYRYHENS